MTSEDRSIAAAFALLLALPGNGGAQELGPADPATCVRLVDQGDELFYQNAHVAAAFALWREASTRCDARDLERPLAARLLARRSRLPENAERAAELLDEAVELLDRHDPGHNEALTDVLRLRSTSERYAVRSTLALADLQTIAELRAERYGADSPEALGARASLLALDLWLALDAGEVDRARGRIAELEAMTRDGAEGEATLSRESLTRLHASLISAYERLGDSKAAARHQQRLHRLVHSRPDEKLAADEERYPSRELP